MKNDPLIDFQAHMLDEAFKDELYEKDDSSKEKTKEEKVTLDKLCKMMKVMRPGAVMQFVAKALGMNSIKFINQKGLALAGKAIKNGWVKSTDIVGSIKDFSKKNKEDKSGIDYSKLKLDPSTMSFKCLFDGDTGKTLNAFIDEFESEIKDESKEIEKADKQLHADVKKAGVKMDEQEIDDNGLAVASVIDNKKNKGDSGKELKKKIEGAIKNDKQAKELQKISEELKKTSSKVKVDQKYEKMSDEELAKLDDKINKNIRNKSEASKKNDAFRNKIKNAVQKGVAEDFKKSVKTAYVSIDKLKKSIASNMKSGLAVEQIKEPRAVCISVQCGKKDFGNVLKEADGSVKIIDVTNGSKDKSIQKVIDYIKKVFQDKIGKDKLGKKTYAYLKNSDGNCLLYVFAGVKQDKLDESLLNEADAAQDIVDKVTSTDVTAPQFSYMTMSKQLSDMDDFFDDGIVNSEEMQKLSDMGSKINEYTNWAITHQGSTDPNIQAKIAEIHKLSNKYYDMLADNQTAINNAVANADDARTGATEATRAASKEMANNEEVKQAASGWKDKLGLGKAFTALGWARLAAKSTAIILNNGKSVVDALGAAALKFKEDKGVIAQMNFLLSNADDSDTKFSDTKFSVRFNINDMKWHATCLDDRKMKFPEDEVIKKALDSEEGKKFKQSCLKKWTPIFDPKDKTRNILTYIMTNFDKIGLKADSAEAKKVSETIYKMQNDFKTIEKEFK